jgi:hypothetical protein
VSNALWRSSKPTEIDMFSSVTKLTAVVALATCVSVNGANAQSYGAGPGMMGMMGQGMMGGFGQMCTAGNRDFSELRLTRLERSLKPTESQREAFEAYKKASLNASEALRAVCPANYAATAPERMEAMEQRMEAMLGALKTVRPALASLYATLSAEQKTVFEDGFYRRRGWQRRNRD